MTTATNRTIFKTTPITNANLWATDFAAKERHRSLTRFGKLHIWAWHCHIFNFSKRNVPAILSETINQPHHNHQLLADCWHRPWRGMFRIFQNAHR